MVGRHHRRIEAARAAQAQPETKALLRRRAKVERKIDHLQDLGMRKARYRGRRKTRLQAFLAATVANFKRLAVLGVLQGASSRPRRTGKGDRLHQSPSARCRALQLLLMPTYVLWRQNPTIGTAQDVSVTTWRQDLKKGTCC